MKSNLGEPEQVDTLAEEGRQISDDNKWWDVRTDHMTFEVQKGNMTVRSVCSGTASRAGVSASKEKSEYRDTRY